MSSPNHHDQNQQPHPILRKIQTLPKEIRNLIAGGLAGMVAKSFVAPIDRIKILYQVTSAEFRLRDVPKVVYSIIENEGYAALWKGNLATMIRVFPYSGIQFMVFDRLKMHFLHEKDETRRKEQKDIMLLREAQGMGDEFAKGGAAASDATKRIVKPKKMDAKTTKGGLSPVESLIGGMMAGTISVMCTYPLDLARAQLAVLRKKKKVKVVEGLEKQTILKTRTKGLGYVLSYGFRQGGVSGLYRGITPTILGILPYSGIAFTINEQAKRQITHIFQREPTTIERIQCGALSGLFAQSIAYPLEVTRRRMQTIGIVPTSGSESAAINFTGVAPALKPSVDELPQTQIEQQPQQVQTQQQMQTKRLNLAGNTSVASGEGAGQGIVSGGSTTAQHHKPPTMITTMQHLFEEQGMRGFFKGVTMNWVKGPIAFSISFTAFDTIQSLIETDSEREKKSQLTRAAIQRRLTNNDD